MHSTLMAFFQICMALTVPVFGNVAVARNNTPNPYDRVVGWAVLPISRVWGATSAVYPVGIVLKSNGPVVFLSSDVASLVAGTVPNVDGDCTAM